MATRLVQGMIIILAFLSILAGPKQGHFTFSLEINSSGAENSGKFDQSHSIYDSLLKKYVHNGRVDYKGFISSDEEFNTYLKQLGSVSESDYVNWSREEKLAFWINAYNAFTIKAVIEHYPIERNVSLARIIYPKNSIRQINGVWDKLQFQAVGKMVTLNEIEHGILRKEFKEPRIHFAIVCASLGCPDLRNEAYRANVIDEQLEKAATEFINNPQKGVRINPADGKVRLSKIFNWFGGDFIGKYESAELFKDRSPKERAVLNFVRKYLKSEEERRFLEGNNFKISYLDYDWSLNELKNAS
jgi:uncharacterized protein DUF547